MFSLKTLRFGQVKHLGRFTTISPSKGHQQLENTPNSYTIAIRHRSSSSSPSQMLSWNISDSLNNPQEVDIQNKLTLMKTPIPTISSPIDVLVKVHATSVNPLDVRMCYGYGRRLLDLLGWASNFEPKITNDRYPLTLGRDFSGEVVAIGPYVRNCKPGDTVYGVIEPQKSGAHAQYVTTPSYCLAPRPKNLSHNEAASIPFAALTAYSALSTFGQLNKSNSSDKQVLVIGGSGGVGSFAIQLLKLWGANVTSTCSNEKLAWLEDTLLVDRAVCYDDSELLDGLFGRFDFVLDCGAYDKTSLKHEDVVERSLKYLKSRSQAVYVTLSPPILNNIDNHGLLFGGAQTFLQATVDTVKSLSQFNSARWAFFLPNQNALQYISHLYEDEAITPQVSTILNFNQLPEAYAKLLAGEAKGKIVIDVTQTNSESSAEPGDSDRKNSGENAKTQSTH